MYLLIGLLTIATVSLTQVNAIPSTEETKGYILPSGIEFQEVFDPRPHGESPVYSGSRWPRTIYVERDNTPTECTEFPDNYGISVEYLFSSDNYTVYCWENTTIYDPAGILFLRTIQDCYVNENDLKAENIDFASRLPNCGPVKPYLVQDSPLLWNTTWEDTAHYTLPCWREPTTKSQRIETAATGFHLYCWVDGEKYGNSTRWWESARLENYKKCYFPAEMFYEGRNQTSGIFGQMPGSGGRCQL